MFAGQGSLGKHVELSAGPYLAPEFTKDEAAPALLDVFGLGAAQLPDPDRPAAGIQPW